MERRRFVKAYKKKQKRSMNELVHERRNKYQVIGVLLRTSTT